MSELLKMGNEHIDNSTEMQEKEESLFADFKMITFSLGGKEYGIDIMRVREISKVNEFTHVPNAAPCVRGVYNLRGDIISVIDLRLLFNLEQKKRDDGYENMIVVRNEDYTSGLIVDSIDRVVAINSQTIQEPHPIFSDINVTFMQGVVEFNDQLYVILNMDKIMQKKGSSSEEKEIVSAKDDAFSSFKHVAQKAAPAPPQPVYKQPPRPVAKPEEVVSPVRQEKPAEPKQELKAEVKDGVRAEARPEVKSVAKAEVKNPEIKTVEVKNIKKVDESALTDEIIDYLKAEGDIVITDLNIDWIESEASKYVKNGLSSKDITDIDKFYEGFYSKYTGRLWKEDLVDSLVQQIKTDTIESIYAWNPGPAQGHEAYSIATALKQAFPTNVIKLWANDTDLLNISMAPTLSFDEAEVDSVYKEYMKESKSGLRFTPEVSDLILFEYHDILHENPYPAMSLIVARDLLSFLEKEEQVKMIAEFEKMLKPGGFLLVGDNERISSKFLQKEENEYLNIYKKVV